MRGTIVIALTLTHSVLPLKKTLKSCRPMCEPQSTKINTVTTKCNTMIELHVLRVFNKANYAKTSPMINLVCDL